MYETLVVGFDDSHSGKAAVVEASNWVRQHGGKVFLVHSVFFDTEEFGIAPEQLEKRLKIGEKVCVRTKDMVTSEFGIEAQYLLCEGEPQDVIIDIAHAKHADLIVLGTYGRRGINRLLMGSVTSRVIATAPIDVLVVKKACTECTGRYQSILVPFDGSEQSRKALIRACELSAADGAEIRVLYVIPRYEEMLDFFKTDSIKTSLFQAAQRILDRATDLARTYGNPIGTEIAEGHAADQIVEAAKKQKTDLISMGSHGYSGVNKALMGSTAERVLMNASCPILIVR